MFAVCIHLWNCNHNEDGEHIHHLNSVLMPLCNPHPCPTFSTPQVVCFWLYRLFVFSRVLYKWNHRVHTLFFYFAMAFSPPDSPVLQYTTIVLFIDEACSVVWLHHNLNIHLPLDGHLGCSRFLVITNKTAMNIHIQVFVWTKAFIFLGYIFTSGIAMLYGRCMLNSLRNFQVIWEFQLFHIFFSTWFDHGLLILATVVVCNAASL